MQISKLLVALCCSALGGALSASHMHDAQREVEQALHLTPDPDNGRKVYLTCAVCHMPEGWGTADGEYPQIAGQLYGAIVKQMADIRARNRDTPTMLPFTMLENLSLQEIADVSAYVNGLPMNPRNTVGPGTDLARGAAMYREYCVECHGEQGEGVVEDHMPLIQGQHFPYLVRQFEWIRTGKRRNGDPEMIKQVEGFTGRDVESIMDYVSRLPPPAERLAEPDWQNPDFPKFVRTAPPKTAP